LSMRPEADRAAARSYVAKERSKLSALVLIALAMLSMKFSSSFSASR
jgi:hypothetical protein